MVVQSRSESRGTSPYAQNYWTKDILKKKIIMLMCQCMKKGVNI